MSLTSPTVSTWAYRPGSWYAVVGSQVTVLLPAEQKEAVVGLWSLVDGGAAFDDALDALLASGLSRLPAFAVVSGGDGPVRVLLRGDGVHAEVTADGEEVGIDGTAGGTWTERTFDDPSSLTLVLPAGDEEQADAGGDLQVLTGLVRVSRLSRPGDGGTASANQSAGRSAAPAPPAPPTPAPPAPAPPVPVASDLDAESGAEDAAEMGPATELLSAVDDPLSAPLPEDLRGPAPDESAPLSEQEREQEREQESEPAAADPLSDPLSDPLPAEPAGDTPDGWVTPWGTSEPTPEPDTRPPGEEPPAGDGPTAGDEPEMTVVPEQSAPPYGGGAHGGPPPPLGIGAWEPVGSTPPAQDHDGLTRAGSLPPPPVPPAPGGFEAAPPAPAVTPPVAQLIVSDGQSVVVDRVVLIGRAPEARRFTSTEQPRLITVPSRQHEISSTHVEVRPGTGADHGSAVVTDMGSTNGTVLVQPGLGPEDLKPGIAVQLIPGAVIDLGDGITIQVTRP